MPRNRIKIDLAPKGFLARRYLHCHCEYLGFETLLPPLPNICPTPTSVNTSASQTPFWYPAESATSYVRKTNTLLSRTITRDAAKWVRLNGNPVTNPANISTFVIMGSLKRNSNQYYLFASDNTNSLHFTIFDRTNCQQILPTQGTWLFEGGVNVPPGTTASPFARKIFGVTGKTEMWFETANGTRFVAIVRNDQTLSVRGVPVNTTFQINFRDFNQTTGKYRYASTQLPTTANFNWVNENVSFAFESFSTFPTSTRGVELDLTIAPPINSTSALNAVFRLNGVTYFAKRIAVSIENTLSTATVRANLPLTTNINILNLMRDSRKMLYYAFSPTNQPVATSFDDSLAANFDNEILTGFFFTDGSFTPARALTYTNPGVKNVLATSDQLNAHTLGYMADISPQGDLVYQTNSYRMAVWQSGATHPTMLPTTFFPSLGQTLMSTFEYDSGVNGFISYTYNSTSKTTFLEQTLSFT